MYTVARARRAAFLLLLCAAVLLAACGNSEDKAQQPIAPAPQAVQKPQSVVRTYVPITGSHVSFVGTKNGDTDVPGTIPTVQGQLTVDLTNLRTATGSITVDLSGLNTELEARDLNIREHFFSVADSAMKDASFELRGFTTNQPSIADGATTGGTLKGQLRFRGLASMMAVPVNVSRDGDRLTVKSTGIFKIQIGDWNLEEAHKKLMEVCGHTMLSEDFPVQFEMVLAPKL